MHLKTLTLRGFKSFASATTLALEPGVTCVVGPNGSGKSNVVDALAWVMGEQGAKNLRGGRMEDVIFAGTAKKQALGRAEVALTIDNSDGAIPIDYTEVTISRTLFRSGGSEYAINGSPARLLDIQELLNDSGLGKEMHVIVGQGRLDEILRADPMERRGFIEEAAGVLKHRRRKDKALRKLTGLQTNLDRLTDLRTELSRQLGPLGRQAKAAKRAAVVQAVLRDSRARLLADDLVQAESRLSAAQPDADPARRRAELEAQLTSCDAEIASGDARIADADEAIEAARTLLQRLGAQRQRAVAIGQRADDRVRMLTAAGRETSRSGEDPDALRARAERMGEDLAEAEAASEARAAELAELTERRASVDEALAAAEDALRAARAHIAEQLRRRSGLVSSEQIAAEALARAQSRITALTEERDGLAGRQQRTAEAVAAAEAELASAESGESDLDAAHEEAAQAQAALEGEAEAVGGERAELASALVEARARADAQRGAARTRAEIADLITADLPGERSALADALRITPGCEIAVTAALGPLAGALIVETREAGEAVLAHAGDGLVDTLFPPTGAAGGSAPGAEPMRAEAPSGEETASAADLLGVADPALAPVIGAALRGTGVAADVDAAAAAVDSGAFERVLTLDGVLVGSGRLARTGSDDGARIAARRELETTEARIVELEAQLAALDERASGLGDRLSAARTAAEKALAALHGSDARIMAAGEALARAIGERDALDRRESALEESLTAAHTALEEAQAAHRSAGDALAEGSEAVEEEPDTGERDRLAAERAEISEALVEARVGARSAEDRVRFVAERIRSLRRQADQEEAARAEAARRAAARRRQAEDAAAIAEIAAGVAEALAADIASADESLDARKRAREEMRSAGRTLREQRTVLADQVAAAANAEQEARLARERWVLRVEELTRRAEDELGLTAESLVEQFGPHLPVPDLEAAHADGDEPASAAEEPDSDPGEGADGDEPASAAESPEPAPAGRPYVRADVEKAKTKAERELSRIGQVNPLALEEFAALQERHDYLEKQIADIERSRKDLYGLVADVDRHVEEVFAAAFADTQREFADIFSRVFPGGEGALTLTDPDDMLTTGVEVTARPAGKKVKRLSLLSGGERSLVAVAMLVAIFKARPSPFYVMDEVEAALDDANLSRLLTIFRELQETSQLIVITHQKRTMEIADALYGVTMHGDGISRVISQRLRDHSDDAEA